MPKFFQPWNDEGSSSGHLRNPVGGPVCACNPLVLGASPGPGSALGTTPATHGWGGTEAEALPHRLLHVSPDVTVFMNRLRL